MDWKSTSVSLRTRARVFFVLAVFAGVVAAGLVATVGLGVTSLVLLAMAVGFAVAGVRDRRRFASGVSTVDVGQLLWVRLLVVGVGLLVCMVCLVLIASM